MSLIIVPVLLGAGLASSFILPEKTVTSERRFKDGAIDRQFIKTVGVTCVRQHDIAMPGRNEHTILTERLDYFGLPYLAERYSFIRTEGNQVTDNFSLTPIGHLRRHLQLDTSPYDRHSIREKLLESWDVMEQLCSEVRWQAMDRHYITDMPREIGSQEKLKPAPNPI